MKKLGFLDNGMRPEWAFMSADRIKGDVDYLIDAAKKQIDKTVHSGGESLTYEAVMRAFDRATEGLAEGWTKVGHLDAVKNEKVFREAYNEMLPVVTEFFTKIYLNNDLWKVIKAYAQSADGKALTGIRKRHLEEVLLDFRESGADLEESKKRELEALEAELAQLTQKYSENVLDATNAYEYLTDNLEELRGLPESAVQAAKEDAESKGHKGKFRFNLHGPSITPVMQYAEDSALREKLWRASIAVGAVGSYDNTDLIRRILELRQKKAELLGAVNFADWVLKRRMAKSGKRALEFSDDIFHRIEGKFLAEVGELEKFRAKALGVDQEKLEPWEIGFWAEKMRKALYDFDEEALRPYFSVDKVMEGMYRITGALFGIEVLEIPGVAAWHQDVKYYEIYDKSSKKFLGGFYADWFPREEKRGGAWMNHFHTGEPGEPHLGVICGNFTKPVSGKPALLTHNEVETIFHEFGHLLHHILGDVEVKSLQGIHVAWDFVELPSQILENWCWERESLNLFAKHWQTGEVIPEDLFRKMNAVRNYLSAMGTMRQLSIGKMDLELHINHRGGAMDLDKFVDGVLERYIVKTKTKAPSLLRRLTHVFGDSTGYAAGYYSYKWAEVLDADAFTRFKQEGILNGTVGKEFREKILSKGNSEPADVLFRAFMGRDPKIDALLERAGLL